MATDASATFHKALCQLEAEHVREVSHLRNEVDRLSLMLKDMEVEPASPGPMPPATVPADAPCMLQEVTDCSTLPTDSDATALVKASWELSPTAASLPGAAVETEPLREASHARASTESEDTMFGFPSSITSQDSSSSPSSKRKSWFTREADLCNMLEVTIVSAEGLRAADWGLSASSDPYVLCCIPDKHWARVQTPVIERTLEPVWDYQGVVADYGEGDDLKFLVRDKDWGRSEDDLLGTATLKAHEFWPDGFEGELELGECGRGYSPKLYIKVKKLTVGDSMREEGGLLPCWLTSPARFKMGASKSWLPSPLMPAGDRDSGRGSCRASGTFADLQARMPDRCILKPDSSARMCWDILGIAVLLVELIWIPMQVFDIPSTVAIILLYWMKLSYWTADIVLGFNTGFHAGDGRLILRRRQVFLNYCRGWLAFDVFIVSIDWFTVLQTWISNSDSSVGDSAGAARAGKLARVMRIARLFRLLRLAKLRNLLLSLQGLIGSEFMTIVFAVGKNLISILVLNHYLACLWFLIGHEAGGTWVKKHNFGDSPYGEQYLVSLHWSLSNFTPGKSPIDADTHIERAFATSILILAMVVATCFVSSITSALGQIWSMNRYQATQAFLLKKFLRQSGISRSLVGRVSRYIDGVLELRQSQVHPSKVDYLGLLSGPLNIELHTEIRLPRLSTYSFFSMYADINLTVAGQVCTSAVTSLYFGKRDVIFKEGDVGEYMRFLTVGSLAYRCSTPTIGGCGHMQTTMKLETDQWCSEAVLWIPWLHCGQMKAVANADVTLLHAGKFIELTTTTEDLYKFAQATAFYFWQNYDPMSTTDMPIENNGFSGKTVFDHGSGAATQVQQAEDVEVRLIQFD